MSRQRSQQFAFTLNNYTQEELKHLAHPKPGYFVLFGAERAPSTGTPHLQGVVWRDPEEFPSFERCTARNVVGKRAWVDKSDSLQGAVGYCVKDGDWWTNLVSHEEVERLKPVIKQAQEFGGEPLWLGSVFFNAVNCPEYEPCQAYYDMWKWNNSF